LINKLDFYIGKIFITKFCKIFFGFLILIFLIDVLESSRKLSQTFVFSDLLLSSLIKSLQLNIEILFFVIFLAALFSFIQLAKTSEIHVIKTSGYNNWKLAKPFLILLILISLMPIGLSNITSTYYGYQSKDNINLSNSGIWLKEKNAQEFFLINFNKFEKHNNLLKDINIICIKCQNISPQSLITAESATFNKSILFLNQVTINQQDQLPIEHQEHQLNVSFSETFMLNQIQDQDLKKLSFFQIWELFSTAKKSGVNKKKYQITIHRYLSNPILFVSVFLLAMIYGNTKPREGSFFKIILIGIVLNFVIYFLITITEQLIYLNFGSAILLLYLPKIILLLILHRKLTLHNF